jgi:hypothetical protein
MDDGFDPVPRLNPVFKGLVFACGLVALCVVVWAMVIVATALMVALPS